MQSKIVKAEEYGLKEDQVTLIQNAFTPKIKEREGFVPMYNELLTKEINRDTCEEAGSLRKKLVKVRTGIATVHKTQKAYFLAAGRFVDAWKNKETEPILQMEENLIKIEKHYELEEKKRLEVLQIKRAEELSLYVEDAEERDLSSMDNDVWTAYLAAKKKAWEDEQKAIKEAEERRKEEEKINTLRIHRRELALPYRQFWTDFERTLDFGEVSEEDFKSFMERNEKAKAEYDTEQEVIRKENEKLRKEKESAESKKMEAIRNRFFKTTQFLANNGFYSVNNGYKHKTYGWFISESKFNELETDGEYNSFCEKVFSGLESLQAKAELKAREAADKEAAEKAEADRQAELNKGDAAKINDLIADLELLKTKYSFSSARNKKVYSDVGILLEKVINHIKK